LLAKAMEKPQGRIMLPAGRPRPDRTSAILHALAYDGDSPRVSFGEIVASLRNRAFGLSMLVFSLPCCLPMPPGIPAACGIVIVLIALQMALGRERLWLPRVMAARSIDRADLRRLVDRVLPYVQRLERICRPRFAVASGRLGEAVIGVVVVVLGVILILPIPILGNVPPGIATFVIAVGVSERDGVIVLIGLLSAAAAIVVTSATAWAALLGLAQIF
jgi:hypothetical protein